MLKSMTAYGRAAKSFPVGHFIAELQSLNRKYLDIQLILPPELAIFETELRKHIENRQNRGKITLRITARFEGKSPVNIRPNLPLVRQLKQAWDEIGSEVGSNGFSLEMLASTNGVLTTENVITDEESYRTSLFDVVDEAMDSFDVMKAAEGEVIAQDFNDRIKTLLRLISEIVPLAKDQVATRRQKLREIIQQEITSDFAHEDKVLREICLYADRVDISEENTRFISHLNQFQEIIAKKDKAKGKTLEFLLQELMRETTTIGSKAVDIEITRRVVEIKTELERIREQVQNVE